MWTKEADLIDQLIFQVKFSLAITTDNQNVC
jgi:hypothetical protein